MKKYKNVVQYVLPPILLGVLVLLGYTLTKTQEIPFETIEIAEWGKARELYDSQEPKLVILAKTQDVLNLDNTISDGAQIGLQNLDYVRYFALGVYQGLKGTNMYGAEIQSILRKGNAIIVYAHFTERDPSIGAGAIMTSPYHIVKIPRQGLNGKIEFVLYSDDKEIIRQYYTMP